MTAEQVNKSINQMRQLFAFFGILSSLIALLSLINGLGEPSGIVGSLLAFILYGLWAVCLWTAFIGLGRRTAQGHIFARICSIIFLLGFPVLTIFGVSYLIKLSKPEMKQALGLELR